MMKTISRTLIAPFIALALACSGLAAVSIAPDEALAGTEGQLAASAGVKTVDAQALTAGKTKKAAKAKKAKKAFAGKYNFIQMKRGSVVTVDKRYFARARAAGYKATMSLKKNGKLVINLFGRKTTGTWKASTTKRAKATLSTGAVVTLKKKGKKITSTNNGVTIVFQKKK